MKKDWTGIITKVREQSPVGTALPTTGQSCPMLSDAAGHPYPPEGSTGQQRPGRCPGGVTERHASSPPHPAPRPCTVPCRVPAAAVLPRARSSAGPEEGRRARGADTGLELHVHSSDGAVPTVEGGRWAAPCSLLQPGDPGAAPQELSASPGVM